MATPTLGVTTKVCRCEAHRLLQLGDEAGRNRRRIVGGTYVRQYHDEFIAAQARNVAGRASWALVGRLIGAQRGAQARGNLAQQFIADGMAQRIVHAS